MKKAFLIIAILIGCLPLMGATWLPFSRGWINSGTGLINVTPYPTGVNTWTPTATATTIPLSSVGPPNLNTLVGLNAGNNLSGGQTETFVGTNSGVSQTTGGENVYVGYNIAGLNTSTGIQNVIVGASSGQSITSGIDNTFLGTHTGLNFTSGMNETFIGAGAGAFASTDSNDVYIGFHAGINANNGDHNVGIGVSSLNKVGTGERNTCLGFGTDQGSSNYSDNVFLGYLAGSDVSGKQDYLEIANRWGPLITGNFNTTSNPGIGVGGAVTATTYAVGSTPTPGATKVINTISGGITVNAGIITGLGPSPTPNILTYSISIPNPGTPVAFVCTPCATTSQWTGSAKGVVPTATPPTMSFIPYSNGVSITLGGSAALTTSVFEGP